MSTALHTYTLLAQVGMGRIQGGWEYIWSAYGIAWASLSLYALSLWLRRPGKAANDAKE
ncbi:hypothetical protein [Archangium lipolyticum]|jgi:hypothetical protein|uniref:hypothetical protein n=1 Tax=Archangium lipolyticum TaxID=2970465 RepID=UPI002149AD46|nr:hypothetical protein [Archangium lipolyticum]